MPRTSHKSSLKDIAQGTPGYAVDTSILVDLFQKAQHNALLILLLTLADVLEELQKYLDDDRVIAFKIGKCGVFPKSETSFDRMNPATWSYASTNLGSIGARWQDYCRAGYSGIVPLAAVSEAVIPKGHESAQMYALWLEEHLQACALQSPELGRCLNHLAYRPGPLSENGEVFLVYVALKFETQYPSELEQVQAEIADLEARLAELKLREGDLLAEKTSSKKATKPKPKKSSIAKPKPTKRSKGSKVSNVSWVSAKPKPKKSSISKPKPTKRSKG